eukprot:1159520-Pelagomonas_calceolata.AAC.2
MLLSHRREERKASMEALAKMYAADVPESNDESEANVRYCAMQQTCERAVASVGRGDNCTLSLGCTMVGIGNQAFTQHPLLTAFLRS